MAKKKKYAILFGFGRESWELLERYKKYKPTLIVCTGKDIDICPAVIKDYAKLKGMKSIVIPNCDGYKEGIVWYDKEEIITITPKQIPAKILSQFEVVISGRRRSDIIKREHIDPPLKFKSSNNIFCPLWES